MGRDAFRKLCLARASRARLLAERRPEAFEALRFFAEIALLQAEVEPGEPLEAWPRLRALVESRGPSTLRTAAQELDAGALAAAIDDYGAQRDTASPRSFFGRVLLQARMAGGAGERRETAPRRCPSCGHPPQVGCLRPRGDGTALSLVCSLCLGEWAFLRGVCCGCGVPGEGNVAYYEATELPHLRVQTCERCRRYLHFLRMDLEPLAVPDADEVAALSLDVWARERGYEKLVHNLVGI